MTEGTPGQSRSVTFHEVAKIAASAAPSHPRPGREGNGANGSHARKRVSVRWKKERRQECQRFGRIVHRGKKTPTLMTPGRPRERLRARGYVFDDDPPKRPWTP